MRLLSLTLLACLLQSNSALANSEVLSLTGDISTTTSKVKAEHIYEKPDDNQDLYDPLSPDSHKVEAEEDKGIFSFLNFFNKEKKPTLKVEAGSTETIKQKLHRTADAGDINSQLTLGYLYLYGNKEEDFAIDYQKAFHYYNLAAAQNDNVAINNLGSLYFSGVGTKVNVPMAVKMFSKASDLGNAEASVNLAFIFLSGHGVVADGNQAIELFKKAAVQNNVVANYMLGYAYFKGYKVPQDLRYANELIIKAANARYDDALLLLSDMYINGWGTPQNYGNGVRALEKAVAQGNVEAMVNLGNILASGSKYPRNLYRAHILFNIAAVRGAENAAEKRNLLEQNLKIEELLSAQNEAERFVDKPSDITIYIRQTFGDNIHEYIDKQIEEQTRNFNKP